LNFFFISGMQPGANRGRPAHRGAHKGIPAPVQSHRPIRVGQRGPTVASAIRRTRFKLIPGLIATQKKIKTQFEQTIASATETPDPLVLIHPQTSDSKELSRSSKKGKKPTWLYLMDSSFFCVRSYNHVPGERKACLRCLTGRWDNLIAHRCKPFPSTRSKPI